MLNTLTIYFPHPPGSGGPGSFQWRLEEKLKSFEVIVKYRGEIGKPDVVFVVGGTRHIIWLFWMKLIGIPVLYRLDGINWLHRKKNVGLKKYLLAEYRNCTNKLIHAFIADLIVYQSHFVKNWWDKEGWRKRKNTSIIFNGVTIPEQKSNKRNSNLCTRLVIMEGTIDYSPYSIRLLNELAVSLPTDIHIELYGNFEIVNNKSKLNQRINYIGFLPREMVNRTLSESVYLSLDINPACPNTVIEALSCGAPVVAFDTGSLNELVPADAGIIVPYGSDPWQLGYPDANALVKAICKIKLNYSLYSKNARKVAKKRYSIDVMTKKYICLIENLL